jgi:hypothetical protein
VSGREPKAAPSRKHRNESSFRLGIGRTRGNRQPRRIQRTAILPSSPSPRSSRQSACERCGGGRAVTGPRWLRSVNRSAPKLSIIVFIAMASVTQSFGHRSGHGRTASQQRFRQNVVNCLEFRWRAKQFFNIAGREFSFGHSAANARSQIYASQLRHRFL